ncbi:MAG TPA: RluA family pseudouridine synthase, partial [Planctomycetes bacterium]|nr:RluA family pseudouridine synthase [Planctomycetota bacterium]
MPENAPRITRIRLDASADAVRADRLLRRLLPQIPLSHIHRMFRKGAIRVDGKKIGPAERLRAGQTLSLRLHPQDAAALD